MEHSDVQHENRQKLLFQSPFTFFANDFHYFPSPFCLLGMDFMGVFLPTCTHLYNKTSPKRKLVESFLGFSFPLVRSCTNLWWFVFRDATLKGNPTNTSRPAWNVKGQQLGVIVSYVSGLPSSRTRRHRVRRGGKRSREWHGMAINGYKWLVPTNKTRDLWMVKQSKWELELRYYGDLTRKGCKGGNIVGDLDERLEAS